MGKYEVKVRTENKSFNIDVGGKQMNAMRNQLRKIISHEERMINTLSKAKKS